MQLRQSAAFCVFFVLILGGNASPAQQASAESAAGPELTVRPGEVVTATVEGAPAAIRVLSGGPDRLLLDPDYVARRGIKPAPFLGRGNLNVAGRREFKGWNRPLDFVIDGVRQKGRAFWFAGAPPIEGDGTIGPWALPQSRVTLVFGGNDARTQRHDFPLFGDISSSSFTGYRGATFGLAVSFDLDATEQYPVASAAAGAAIAKAYGGQLSGPSWDIDILLGVKRPVRLMTLSQPFVFGPLSFDRIAVRVRDRIDSAGRGDPIPDGTEDPSEIVVAATKKGPQPRYGLNIPRAGLSRCSKLTFDKAAKRIELWCNPA
ncbi:MAG: hypothetical protein B7Y43_02470 [Sphingomonas sp. 28-62-20]|uniref:hypothetical protein n=1 Tax=unclassified Sphingomonas TaxID=196159 RepID=UPI000BC61C80|nr:hypothetical protein [Sphingomonas sp.]OYY79305.1 MAG: hypothetical protein B7Y43_02470 [Sphingomonas sp. 28-62-20]